MGLFSGLTSSSAQPKPVLSQTEFKDGISKVQERITLKLTPLVDGKDRRFSFTAKALHSVTGSTGENPKQLQPVDLHTGEVDRALHQELQAQLRARAVSVDRSSELVNLQSDKIDKPITEGERTRFQGLIAEVRNRFGGMIQSLREKSAIAKVLKFAFDRTLESTAQQAYQLESFQQLLDLVQKVNSGEQRDALLSGWHGNRYQHYIRAGDNGEGAKAANPAEAINIVMERVSKELGEDGQGALTPQTMRDISALTTALGKVFKPNVSALAELDNMLAFIEENRSPGSAALGDLEEALKQLPQTVGGGDAGSMRELNEFIAGQREQNGVLSQATIDQINTLYKGLAKNEELAALPKTTLRYPDEGAPSWDEVRPMDNNNWVRTRGYYAFVAAKLPSFPYFHVNSGATYSAVDSSENRLTNSQYPKSGFGPSVTVWHTTRFMDVMLNASKEQQKVYATGQASDWASNNTGNKKYSGSGAHTEAEVVMTFLDSSSNGKGVAAGDKARRDDLYLTIMQHTMMRAIDEMRIGVVRNDTTGRYELAANPRTKEGLPE